MYYRIVQLDFQITTNRGVMLITVTFQCFIVHDDRGVYACVCVLYHTMRPLFFENSRPLSCAGPGVNYRYET